MRYHSSQFGDVSPTEFIPILEETNMIIPPAAGFSIGLPPHAGISNPHP